MRLRFWSFVGQNGPGECWDWHGYVDNGYPIIAVPGGKGQIVASRLSWKLHGGVGPGRYKIKRRCGNKVCVNGDHLYIAPVRIPRRMTPDTVRELRLMWASGYYTQAEIAATMDIHITTVRNIIYYATHSHVP